MSFLFVLMGIAALGIGIWMLARKEAKKVPGIILIVFSVFFFLIGLVLAGMDDDEPTKSNDEPGPVNAITDVPDLKGITVDDEKIKFDSDYAEIVIEPDEAEEHPEDTIKGVTAEGLEWSTSKKDGTGEIHMKVDGKNVTAKVTPKEDKKTGNKAKADAGKAAAAASKVVTSGYKKGVMNYNRNYAIWYVEAAQCLVYYPAQLKLSKTYENQTAVFTDSRSKASLKITLGENAFKSMDEVESMIASTEYNKVLASGTDWYSTETKGKSMTEFAVVGLGNEYTVTAALTYENRYSFVFDELCKLIKCKFVEGGKWVSKVGIESVGKKVPALAKKYDIGAIDWRVVSYFMSDLDCILNYPDVFTKMYIDGPEETYYFTDPVTGAYIKVYREFSNAALIGEVVSDIGPADYEILDDSSMRCYTIEQGSVTYYYVKLANGWIYRAEMIVPESAESLYKGLANGMTIYASGDSVEAPEMTDIFYAEKHCIVTIPVTFQPTSDSYTFVDYFNGTELNVLFAAVDESDTGNIFDTFSVIANDGDINVEDAVVRWHNNEGLHIGGIGANDDCLVEVPGSKAYSHYSDCWTMFDIRFTDDKKAPTIAETIEEEKQEAAENASDPEEEDEPWLEPNQTEPTPTQAAKADPTPTPKPATPTPEPDPGPGDPEEDSRLYDEIAEEIGFETIYDYGMALYGTANYISYQFDYDYDDFRSRNMYSHLLDLDALLTLCGLKYQGVEKVFYTERDFRMSIEDPTSYGYVYSGEIKGHEDLGNVHVVVRNDIAYEMVDVSWLYDDYEGAPVKRGEMYITDSFVDFINDYFCYGAGRTSATTVWHTANLSAYLMAAAEQYEWDRVFEEQYELDDTVADRPYYVMGGDTSGNYDWFGVSVCDFDENGEMQVLYRVIYSRNGDEWDLLTNANGYWEPADVF
ncbi:MAG: tetraspanin family protein [Lachnospiraceae bacterium]|nr:tetraspanin family protein [Lachnospiraceae bacterium]